MSPLFSLTTSTGAEPTRRGVLRAAGAGAGALSLAALAGCDLGSASSNDSSTPSGNAVAGGTLRIGLGGGSSASSMDAHHAPDPMTSAIAGVFYNQLTKRNGSFELVDELADELAPEGDGTVWNLTLKSGVKFHDGRTVTAADVIATFTRVLDPATAATVGGQVAMITSMEAVDDLTVKFTLNTSTGWFDVAVGDTGLLGIVPADYDPAKPVGTGPFRFESFEAGVSCRLGRFDDYFGGKPLLDAVELIVLNDDSARYNALEAGQVDVVYGLSAAQASQISSNPNLSLYDKSSGTFNPITMRVDEGPTADVRVRQALRLCLDRNQVVASAYGGHGRVGNDLYGPDDSDFRSDLTRTQDLEKARALVAEAGASGLSAEVAVANLGGTIEACTVLAQNASEIGITLRVNQVDTATLFGPNYLSWPIAVDSYPSLGILAIAAISDGPEAVINQTHFADADYEGLYRQASATTDEAERKTLLGQMQEILFERGGYIIPAYGNTLMGTKSTVTGWSEENKTSLEQFRDLYKVGFSG